MCVPASWSEAQRYRVEPVLVVVKLETLGGVRAVAPESSLVVGGCRGRSYPFAHWLDRARIGWSLRTPRGSQLR